MNTIAFTDALMIIGKDLLTAEKEFATALRNANDLERCHKQPYRVGFMSYLFFANENEAISISSSANFYTVASYLESPDTTLHQNKAD
jgi:hypothetical protein